MVDPSGQMANISALFMPPSRLEMQIARLLVDVSGKHARSFSFSCEKVIAAPLVQPNEL